MLTDTKTIDDLEFTTQKLPARKAFALQNKILKLIAPVLGALTTDDAASSISKMNVASLATPLMQLFDKLEGPDAEKLLIEILGATSVNFNNHVVSLGKGEALDVVFTGRLMTMYRAAAFALEWNFKDFFDAARAAIAKLSAAQKAEAAKPRHLST